MFEVLLATKKQKVAFSSLRKPDFRSYTVGGTLWMMGDNIEHVISYWVIFATFQSPLLGGYAVLSHWAPSLLFGVHAGALADRFDNRKITIFSMFLFILTSTSWAVLFLTDSIQVWHAVILLTIHGLAGSLYQPANQLLVHDIVGDDELQSAVRISSTSRQLGIFLGPVVGGFLLLVLGSGIGLLVNTLFFIPLVIWCLYVPYTGHLHLSNTVRRPLRLGVFTAVHTIRQASKNQVILSMVVLGGASSFLVGNAYQAQMPQFATNFLPENAGLIYTILLSSSAAGAIFGGVFLEVLSALSPRAMSATILAGFWSLSVILFAAAPNYAVAIVGLFIMGIMQISFTSMATTLVQLEAPPEQRGQIIGVYNMALNGLRFGSGITVGFMGAIIGINLSLGLSALVFTFISLALIYSIHNKSKPSPKA